MPATLPQDLPINKIIEEIVQSISAFDEIEQQHIVETLTWIRSGAPLFRVEKPATPPKHLVSYFVLIDEGARKILLVDHKKAQLWLPSGGHVEPEEHPAVAVTRECFEELGITAEFWQESPLFITSTQTVGLTAGHTDVSLWYVLKGDHLQTYTFDQEEFNSIRWFDFDEIPYDRTDPHMARFMAKLKRKIHTFTASQVSRKITL